jgi:hypothetical protein
MSVGGSKEYSVASLVWRREPEVRSTFPTIERELRVQSGTRIIELPVSHDSEVRFGSCGKLPPAAARSTRATGFAALLKRSENFLPVPIWVFVGMAKSQRSPCVTAGATLFAMPVAASARRWRRRGRGAGAILALAGAARRPLSIRFEHKEAKT